MTVVLTRSCRAKTVMAEDKKKVKVAGGREIDKKSAEKRFGKFFCNSAEAEEFVMQVEKQREETPKQKSGGGCC